jgi:tetratricopeptide (TPR) repeat protein
MFTVLLLTTLLAAADPQAPEVQAPQPEDLAEAGNYKEALDGFRRRAAANANDLDARLWIAWLHEKMGRADLAEPVYRSVVLEAPGHVDAALHFATLLAKQKHHDEAVRVLERAKSADPMNPELLTALGNAHLRVDKKSQLGRAYLEMAAALSPKSVNSAKHEKRVHPNSKSTSAPAAGAGS